MPIRFRCLHCNQLLGIARRKAGMQVSCPTCRKQVVVPYTDQVEHEPVGVGSETAGGPRPGSKPPSKPPSNHGPAPAPAPPLLFERDDFDDLLKGGQSPPRPEPARPEPAAPVRLPLPRPAAGPEPLPEVAPESAGIYLSPGRATILTVVFIVLLAVAFGAGLVVGRFCFGP